MTNEQWIRTYRAALARSSIRIIRDGGSYVVVEINARLVSRPMTAAKAIALAKDKHRARCAKTLDEVLLALRSQTAAASAARCLTVPCGYCSAEIGDRCRTIDGSELRSGRTAAVAVGNVHRIRLREAARSARNGGGQ